MKQLRSVAFLSLIVFLIVLLSPSSSGQSAQTPSPSPASPATGDTIKSLSPLNTQANAARTPAQPGDGAWRRPVIGKAVPTGDQPAINVWIQPTAGQTRLRDASQAPDRNLDPGIFLKQGDGNVCGSIVSYNFSSGENPQLQSVTTCTPRGWVATRRAQDKGKKPSAPLFQTTEYSPPRQ